MNRSPAVPQLPVGVARRAILNGARLEGVKS